MGLWLLLTVVNAYATSIPTETGKPYSGTLPVLYINTEGGVAITSKEEYVQGTYYIDALGLEGYSNLGSKESPLALQIKGRGNYTWTGFDKKPYHL